MENRVKILGVRVDNFSTAEMKKKIDEILDVEAGQKFLVTLNPEIILKARGEEEYKEILNCADLNICDGFGLKLASCLSRKDKGIKGRFPGADLVRFLLEKADERKMTVLVVAAMNSLSSPKEIARAIQKNYPNLTARSEYFSDSQEYFENGIIGSAEIVFVNFGAPEQEKFIYKHKNKFSNAKLLVGIGGSCDFLTGKMKRAPKILRSMGMEWSWRLIQEPKRWRRILNATIVFPYFVITEKNKSKL